MLISFLELSRVVTIEVAAGRYSPSYAKQLLRINSDIVVNNTIKERIRLWKSMIEKRNIAIDSPDEGIEYGFESDSSGNARRPG